MGSCLSSRTSNTSDPFRPATAKVVAADGSLREYSLPAEASHALHGDDPASYFLCNSDQLLYDAYVPAMRPRDALASGEIYFVLPAAMLDRPLAVADMVALATKASSALSAAWTKEGRRRSKRIQVMPFVEPDTEDERIERSGEQTTAPTWMSPPETRSKMERSSTVSRASGRLSRRPYRRWLSKIEEVDE